VSRRNPRVRSPLVRGRALVRSQPAAPNKIQKSLTYLAPSRAGLGAAKRQQTRNTPQKTGGKRGDLFSDVLPDNATSFKVGEFSTMGEAELVAEEYYGDMHVELEQRPGGLIVLWVWE
jgi:hypothetical protein